MLLLYGCDKYVVHLEIGAKLIPYLDMFFTLSKRGFHYTIDVSCCNSSALKNRPDRLEDTGVTNNQKKERDDT